MTRTMADEKVTADERLINQCIKILKKSRAIIETKVFEAPVENHQKRFIPCSALDT